MRWLLADPNNPEEQKYKQHVIAATERWWQAFSQQAANIKLMFQRKVNFDLVRFMNDYWQPIHPRLSWEFGPGRTAGGHRLCVTPESAYGLRPMLQYVLSRAPQLPGWEFYAHKLPDPVDNVMILVDGRVGVDVRGAKVIARGARGRKVDLTFALPRQVPEDKQHEAAFVLAEGLVGEETLDSWIAAIDVAPANADLRGFLPLERAQDTISSVLRAYYDQLPTQTDYIFDDSTQVHSYQLQPEPADDYPNRSDFMIGSTRRMDVTEAAILHRLFNSRCHSRLNERFCYLKMDVSAVPSTERVEYRAQFEDPLMAALQQAQLGGVFGSGSGVRYSYIDLALTNVTQGLSLIRQVLGSRNAPVRTWLEFFDTEFECEWAGLYPQTPPPPANEE